MKRFPQIRLRTILVLFVCAAVGLATYRSPIGSLQPAIAAAMVIGLLQQIRQLRGCKALKGNREEGVVFAWRFAVVWRTILTAMIGCSVITDLLIRNDLLALPDRKDIPLIWPFPSTFLQICMILVLCNSVARWRSAGRRRRPGWAQWALLAFGFAITVAMVIDSNTMLYLVHRATASVHEAIPPAFRRPGVYPDLRTEGYLSVWKAVAAVIFVVAAGNALVWANRDIYSAAARRRMYVVAVMLLTVPLLFCWWYYSHEYHRISPDFASAGLALNWLDLLAGAAIAAMVITAGAYRMSTKKEFAGTISTNLAKDIDSTALHESFPCLVVLGINAVFELGLCVAQLTTYQTFRPIRPLWAIASSLTSPISLLSIALAVASLQLCWIRWQRRTQEVSWELAALRPSRFYWNWITLALIGLIGIPTLSAFAFVIWLGPIGLPRLLGF